ncbi:MAG: ABC transporter ATP-binding protein [Bacteroidota bacterium]|nr:ABC transporter ATP-binding protein [Bacteroidota bacterium]
MSFVEFKNANYGYNKSFHLSDVSFSIPQGILAGIIGPNGSGKSTLLKGITGELPVSENQVYLKGKDLCNIIENERAKEIAVVTQFSEPIDITVEEFVLMGRIPYRKKYQFFESNRDCEIARKYMELTDTYHLRGKKFSNLSGGERQLASIAKALTQEPSLLLLDEPTSHLDISHQVQILNLIQELTHELGLTVIMVIHDLNLASEYCDYLVLMNEGALYKHGTPNEILNFKNIEEVYNTLVVIQDNPISKKPSIFLVSNKILRNSKKSNK